MKIKTCTCSIPGKGRGFFLGILLAAGCILSLGASELFTFPAKDPEGVIRLDLQKISKILQGKRSGADSPQRFHDLIGSASDILDMNRHCSEVLISIYSLRKSRCLIFCKTSLQEKDLKALLQKKEKQIKVTARPCGGKTLYQITGGEMKNNTLFAAYLADGVVLFSSGDPSPYLLSKTPKGLTQEQRSYIKMQYPVSGYLIPHKKTYRKNPFFPRFSRILFYAAILRDSSVNCFMEGPLAPGEDPERKLQQVQQIRMMFAILLNNVDPSLSEEFMQNGQVYRRGGTLYVSQYLSPAFREKIYRQGIGTLLPARKKDTQPVSPLK